MELNFSGPCAEKGNTLILLMSMRFTTVSINSQSAFYPWSAVFSLYFTPSLQSAVCILHWPLPRAVCLCDPAGLFRGWGVGGEGWGVGGGGGGGEGWGVRGEGWGVGGEGWGVGGEGWGVSQLFETNSSLKCQPSLLPNPQGVMGRRQLTFQTITIQDSRL